MTKLNKIILGTTVLLLVVIFGYLDNTRNKAARQGAFKGLSTRVSGLERSVASLESDIEARKDELSRPKNGNEAKSERAEKERASVTSETTFIHTNFGDISYTASSIYDAVKPFGSMGGIAAWGDKVLMLSRAGRFSIIDPKTGAAKRLDVSYDNGFAEFLRVRERLGLDFPDHWMRFYDVEVQEVAEGVEIFATLSFWDAQRACYGFRLISTVTPELETASIESNDWRVLFESSPCLELNAKNTLFGAFQGGGRIVLSGDETIYFSTGDFTYDGRRGSPQLTRDPDSGYGKVYRASTVGDANPSVVSMGHRNPQGLAQASDGTLWLSEHGPQGGDELNTVLEGKDYGWPAVTLGVQYGETSWTLNENERHSGYEAPNFAWVPSVGPSQILVVKDFWSKWEGDLIVGTLKDQSLRRLRVIDGRVVYDERIPISHRIRDIVQLESGDIVILSDKTQLLYFPRPDKSASVDQSGLSSDAKATLSRCIECHSLSKAATHTGAPGLWGVIGRPVASTSFDGYSDEMLTVGGRWTTESLSEYLADPTSLTPSSTMARVGQIQSARVRAEIVEFLKGLN